MRTKIWFRMICCGFGLAVLLATAPAARADNMVFNDGLPHVFHGSCDDLTVRNNFWDEPTSVEMVSGAEVGSYAYAYDTSRLTVSGGTINYHLYAYDSSEVAVSGGTIGWRLYALGSSQVTVSGGTIEEIMMIWSTVTVEGSDFSISGVPVPLGTYTRFDERDPLAGALSGTFGSGETFTNNFEIHGDGQLVLIPEPATLALLALGGLLLIRRRAAVGYATKR